VAEKRPLAEVPQGVARFAALDRLPRGDLARLPLTPAQALPRPVGKRFDGRVVGAVEAERVGQLAPDEELVEELPGALAPRLPRLPGDRGGGDHP
jgi:hypothetical protein